MAGHTKWEDIKRGGTAQLPPEEGRGEGLGLGELRATVGMNQVDLARAMQIDQPRVSRIERQDDLYLSTLRDYVRGLGGELELLARFPDDRVIWIEPPTDLPLIAEFVNDVEDAVTAERWPASAKAVRQRARDR